MSTPSDNRFRTQNVALQARLQGAPLASFRARAAAFAIDLALVGLLLMLPSLGGVGVHRDPGASFSLSLELGGGLLSFAVMVAYFGLSTFLGKGATPGKWALGIRVVSLVHDHMSLWHSIERALGYTASSLEAGFGFLQYFNHPNRQTVHDRIAETIVVVSRGKRTRKAA